MSRTITGLTVLCVALCLVAASAPAQPVPGSETDRAMRRGPVPALAERPPVADDLGRIEKRLREVRERIARIEAEAKTLRAEAGELDRMLREKAALSGPQAGPRDLRVELAELQRHLHQAELDGRTDQAQELRGRIADLKRAIEARSPQSADDERGRLKEKIVELRRMAGEAKEQGDLERSGRLWAQAQELEQSLQRETAPAQAGRAREAEQIQRRLRAPAERQGKPGPGPADLSARVRDLRAQVERLNAGLEELDHRLSSRVPSPE